MCSFDLIELRVLCDCQIIGECSHDKIIWFQWKYFGFLNIVVLNLLDVKINLICGILNINAGYTLHTVKHINVINIRTWQAWAHDKSEHIMNMRKHKHVINTGMGYTQAWNQYGHEVSIEMEYTQASDSAEHGHRMNGMEYTFMR